MSPQAVIARDSRRAARHAGLRYVSPDDPGITRRGSPKRFSYRRPDGRPLGARELARIRSLVIPPAWADVWICLDPEGHIQAVGRDARGRKQYRYHPRWRQVRDTAKYGRLLDVGHALPKIRARVGADLARDGLPRAKVLALVVKLLDTCFIRIGNEEYARTNNSYGLTTLKDGHARFDRGKLALRFRTKSGKMRHVELTEKRLVRLVKKCQELPGQQLFQYETEDGQVRGITSDDVNDYLRTACGDDITAKDFRTWAATLCAAESLSSWGPAHNKTHGKSQVVRAIQIAADRLGNTPAVCRRAYVHPGVIDAYAAGALTRLWGRCLDKPRRSPSRGLRVEERALLGLLESMNRVARRA